MRVLVVDDDPTIRAAVAQALHGTAEVVGAPDGPTALARLAEAPTDLILLEIALPGMNGYELLARLRRSRDHADRAAIVLTTRTGEADRVKAYRTGADGYVTKPFDGKDLHRVVGTVAGSTPGQRLTLRQAELGRALLLRQIEQHFSA